MRKIFGYLLSFLLGVVGCFGFGLYTFNKKRYFLNKRRPPINYAQYKVHNVNYEASALKDYIDISTDISFDTRMAAERTLTILKAAYLEKYGVATIADLKEISGLRAPYSDNDYGWTNLAFARVYRARDGKFYLDLPDAMPIDKD